MFLPIVTELNVKHKRVLLRLDLNLPKTCSKEYDLSRLKRSLLTIKYLIAQEAKVVILSHNGSPKGKFIPSLSLAPVTDLLKRELGGQEIKFLLDVLSPDASNYINRLLPGEVLIAENLRFHAAEEANDLEFAKKIAALGDFYVNEAFSCSHRVHASIVSLPKFLPSGIGLLMAEELVNLHRYLQQPNRPMMGIVGGAKMSTKLIMLKELLKKVDLLVIGGAMANTFLKADGCVIGRSIHEPECLALASQIVAEAIQNDCILLMPCDFIVTKETGECRIARANQIQDNETILDLGPSSIFDMLVWLNKMATVVWNGPLGAFEQSPFSIGTSTVARAIAGLTTQHNLISVIGGGDIVSAINSTRLEPCFTYVSTGGGAFLKWLEGKILPGIEAIQVQARISL